MEKQSENCFRRGRILFLKPDFRNILHFHLKIVKEQLNQRFLVTGPVKTVDDTVCRTVFYFSRINGMPGFQILF